MRVLRLLCALCALLSLVIGQARADAVGAASREAVGAASREAVGVASREAVGVLPRSSAATTSVDRGFLDECTGCVSTFEELREALGGPDGLDPLPAGDTVVTLCRSTKTAPLVLEGSIGAFSDGAASLSIQCCGAPAYDPSDERPPLAPRWLRRRAGVVPRLGRKCVIQRANAFAGLDFSLEDGSVSVSSIAFREAEDPINPDFPFGRPVVSVAGVAPRNLVLFNR